MKLYWKIIRLLFGLTILIGIIVGILFVALTPGAPAIRVEIANVTSLGSTLATESNATFNFIFIFQNGHKMYSISNYDLGAVVWSESNKPDILSFTNVAPFTLGEKKETKVHVQFQVVNKLMESDVAKRISAKRTNGSIDFGVELNGKISFTYGHFLQLMPRHLKVDCYKMDFSFPTTNNHNGQLMAPCDCSRKIS